MPRDLTKARVPVNHWKEFFSAAETIHVNDVHGEVHCRQVAADIVAVLPGPQAQVLDYGPGAALFADRVAAAAGHLFLCEMAEQNRRELTDLYTGNTKITVMDEDTSVIPGGSVDLMIVNSVLQYLTSEELDELLAEARRLLRPGGRLLIGDVIPKNASRVADTLAFLRFAARHRFLREALTALAKTTFSFYGRIRKELGLTLYDESEMMTRLIAAGYSPRRHRPNLSHNQARLSFMAEKV